MIDRSKVSDLVPEELIKMLNQLDDKSYILLCHSEKVNEVKQWNLPYRVIGNNWFDKSIVDKNRIYVIPDYNNRPLAIRYE